MYAHHDKYLNLKQSFTKHKSRTVKSPLSKKLSSHMEQSPSSEANSHSAGQEIPRLLWNLEVHYRVHNSPQLVPDPDASNPNLPTLTRGGGN